MKISHRHSAEAASAQPLTEELVARAGISPGMRVVVFGEGIGDLALLVAERVGPSGAVLGIAEDERAIAQAERCAREQCFAQVTFRCEPYDTLALDAPVDAAIGRFFLMGRPEPVGAIRRAASLVRPGGRVIFHEWHLESMLCRHTSSWPELPLYRKFARTTVDALRSDGVHVDMGLRLPNAFVEAGLSMPAVHTDLRAVSGSGAHGYAFFDETLPRVLAAMQRLGVDPAHELRSEAFAARLEQEAVAAGGHAFLPLQVGVWSRK
ncbi:MAG: methyltransferase domain-containing protein [Candidatus Baltobacteraceae bacterium]